MVKNPPKIEKLIETVLESYNERAAQIIRERYGLKNSRPKTLAELGKSYGVTRERIRQIEAAALEDLRKRLDKESEAKRFVESIHSYLDNVGNLRRSDLLAKDLIMLWRVDSPEAVFSNRINFLADVLESPEVIYGDHDWHDVWSNDKRSYELAKKVATELLKTKDHDFDKFLDNVCGRYKLPTFLVVNYITISKDFGVGPYGDLGAHHWLHVNPKTIRDKSYLVLKRVGAPLHFKEVASLISKLGKKAHPGTVHNELIKDPRFVWVKRGTYALKEHL